MRPTFTLAIVLILPVVSLADTINVVGVVVDESGERAAGVRVGLYAVEEQRQLADDRTSEAGVFSLVVSNVFGIEDVTVAYEGEDFVAEPILVQIGPSTAGVRTEKTSDLQLLAFPDSVALSSLPESRRGQLRTALFATQSIRIAANGPEAVSPEVLERMAELAPGTAIQTLEANPSRLTFSREEYLDAIQASLSPESVDTGAPGFGVEP